MAASDIHHLAVMLSAPPVPAFWSRPRLARSTVGLWDIVKRLEAVDGGGAGLRILNLGGEVIDTRSATGRLILTIFAGFAQFEREIMLERQREGAFARRRPRGSTRPQEGLGSRIIGQMTEQLRGTARFDWRTEGLDCEITLRA